MKDNNLLLNIAIDSEFVVFSPNLNQSFKVEGKKRILETVCSTMVAWHMIIPCFNGLFTLGN